jgi:hypothetical protein
MDTNENSGFWVKEIAVGPETTPAPKISFLGL